MADDTIQTTRAVIIDRSTPSRPGIVHTIIGELRGYYYASCFDADGRHTLSVYLPTALYRASDEIQFDYLMSMSTPDADELLVFTRGRHVSVYSNEHYTSIWPLHPHIVERVTSSTVVATHS